MTDAAMSSRTPSRLMSPAALLGAGVLVASLGAAAGWMVHSQRSASDTAAPAQAAQMALAPNETVLAPNGAMPASAAATAVPQDGAMPAPVADAQKQAPARHSSKRDQHRSTDRQVASNGGTTAGSGTSGSAGSTTPMETRRVATCDNCGVIEGVRSYQRKGEGTGMGAVGGAVLGGVVGHQVGGGNGKKAMTVLGAIGGGLAGHEAEKRMRAETVYEVRVRMDDGTTRTFTRSSAPTPGARVVVEGNSFRTVSHDAGGSSSTGNNGQGV